MQAQYLCHVPTKLQIPFLGVSHFQPAVSTHFYILLVSTLELFRFQPSNIVT